MTVAAHTDTDVLEVADDGPGIPHEHRERIFTRFTRLDDSRDRDAGGTGLGLAIARETAIRHGGTLRLTDTPPGAGVRFIAELPRPTRVGLSRTGERRAEPRPSLTALRHRCKEFGAVLDGDDVCNV